MIRREGFRLDEKRRVQAGLEEKGSGWMRREGFRLDEKRRVQA